MSTTIRTRASRHRRPVLALFLALTLVFTAAATGTADADSKTCVKPPGALLLFHASFSGGSMKLGSATGTGLAADACGSIAVVGGKFVSTVQPADMSFAPVTVKLGPIGLPANIVVNAPVTGPATIGPGFASADIALTADITASASVLGFTCGIGPIKPTLTTGKSGSLQGTTFTGSLAAGYSGKVVANDFAVPAIQPSRTCPRLIAAVANIFVGLPAAPGKASIEMNGSIKIG